MDKPLHGQDIAGWVARPIVFAGAVTAGGIIAFILSLLLPVGMVALALGVLGGVATSAGLLTLALLWVGRATGLEARSARAVEGGRDHILFAGSRPPAMHYQPRNPPIPRAGPGAQGAQGAQQHIDLTDPSSQPTAVPQDV